MVSNTSNCYRAYRSIMYLLPHKYNFTSIGILNLSRFYLNFEELYRDLIQIKIVVRTTCFPIFRIIFQCCYIKSLDRILNIEIRTALINLIVCYCDNIIAGEKIRRYFQLFICRFVSPRGFNYHSYWISEGRQHVLTDALHARPYSRQIDIALSYIKNSLLLLTFAIVAERLIVNVCPPLLFTTYAVKAWIRAPNLPRERQTLHQLRQTNNDFRK